MDTPTEDDYQPHNFAADQITGLMSLRKANRQMPRQVAKIIESFDQMLDDEREKRAALSHQLKESNAQNNTLNKELQVCRKELELLRNRPVGHSSVSLHNNFNLGQKTALKAERAKAIQSYNTPTDNLPTVLTLRNVDIAHLHAELESKDQFINQIQNLNRDACVLEVKRLNSQGDAKNDEIALLKRESSAFRKENSTMRLKFDALLKQQTDLESRYTQLLLDLDILRTSIGKANFSTDTAVAVDTTHFKQALDDLRLKYNESQARAEKSEKELSALQFHSAAVEEEYRSVQAKYSELLELVKVYETEYSNELIANAPETSSTSKYLEEYQSKIDDIRKIFDDNKNIDWLNGFEFSDKQRKG